MLLQSTTIPPRVTLRAPIAILALLAVTLAPIAASARSNGFILRRTDAPGDSTCAVGGCHDDFSVNDPAGMVTLSILDEAMAPVATYEPGTLHAWAVSIESGAADRNRWGFQLVPLVDSTTAMAGSFPAQSNTAVMAQADGGTGRTYLGHTSSGTRFGAPAAAWTFEWQAPMSDVGDVTFYVCGNAADGGGSTNDDYIQCGTFTVAANAADPDTDGDGLTDSQETMLGTSPTDADTDDDGISDGDEVAAGTSPLDCDTDMDGLPDGLESGVTMPLADTDTNACFIADTDPATTTDPLDAQSDGESDPSCLDGDEDANANGAVDVGETDPNLAGDCPPVAGPMSILRVTRTSERVVPLAVFALDPCTAPSDLRACAETTAMQEDFEDPALPVTIAGAGVLVFIELDSDLSQSDPEGMPSDLIIVEKNGTDLLLSALP